MLLAIDWAGAGIKALQFIFSFSIIVTLHELGHYLTARWFGCRVEKFYLFFNPWFSLWKKKIGDTEYGIGWIPFGGYVKIAGMMDESMDKEQMKQPPQSWEFRSKPAWQRLIVMVAGVFVNLVLGFLIYAMILCYWGESYVPVNKMTYGISADSLSQSIGLQNGDKIVSVDGKYYDQFKKLKMHILLGEAKTIEVERAGVHKTITIPENFASELINHRASSFIDMRMPFTQIDVVADTMAAAKAGIKKGDKVIAINNMPIQFFDEFQRMVKMNTNQQIALSVVRDADTGVINVQIPSSGKVGISNTIEIDKVFEVTQKEYSILQAIPAGFTKSIETIESYWLQLKMLFGGKVKAKDTLGGIISIGNMYAPAWDWQNLWMLTAFFSLVLAFMNILPIPALDGGHALFCIVEMVTRRKPNEKFMEYAQTIGMILLLGLMVVALGLDFWRLFR